ncbi:hypothetical protein VNO77_05756 [Canavalia gladiata]|uniref:CW-type domain-containing protein n=1 Tax=Canavalia gladiata TaxID=3824 RepID=A0AAN9N461_CANGL
MQSNTEYEEGEAFCYEDDDDNIDLDSLSYIVRDERIQHVLGHFRKDFEGGISAERLGAKFGDYGSFLPTCERSPPFQSCPKTPQKHCSLPKSPRNLHMAAAFHNSRVSSSMPSCLRLGTASHNAHPFRNLRVPSVDDSGKNTGTSSSEEMEKCTLKDDCAKKAGNLTDQRTLKLRIKVKSDILAKKNAAIYSGLGLDYSPSSSMGTSPAESEDMSPVSQETPEESPTSIVQVMTSFTIPGGVLISPLHDSLLYLIRKEKFLGDRRPVFSLNGHQEHYSISTDESDSFVGDRHMSKKRKVAMVDQSEKQHMNGNCSEKDMVLDLKRRLGNRTPDRKDFLSNDLKCTPLSSSICDAGETAEFTGKALEVSKEVNKDGVQCRMVSIEAVKEDSLESISGQDFDKIEKQNTENSFMKKAIVHKLEISQNNKSTDPKNNSKYNTFTISKKVKRDAVNCKVDQDTENYETNQKGKVKSESKNMSKGEWYPGKVTTAADKDSIGTINNAMVTDKKSSNIGVACKNKMHKIKSLKDNKIRGCDKDSLKGKKSEWKVDETDQIDGPALNKVTMNANLDNIVAKSVYKVKVKERQSGSKIVNQLLAGPCVKDVPGACPIAENKPTSEVGLSSATAAPQLIEEDWVCCDRCQKWRLLPLGLKPEQLPEKWLCSMLYWLIEQYLEQFTNHNTFSSFSACACIWSVLYVVLTHHCSSEIVVRPGMNRCNISEEDTTKALYALYQMPISESQNNMQSHGVISVGAPQLGPNYMTSSSGGVFDRGKKKHGIKEKAKSGINNDMHPLSNREKNNAHGSVKNRSLIDMNHKAADSNSVKKSSSKHLSRLNNVTEEKNTPKENEKQSNGGDRNPVKLKRKMDTNQYRSGTPKKSKMEDVCYADKQLNPGMEFEKVGLNSRNGLPTKAGGKNMRKYVDYCLSDNLQRKLVVPVKKGDQAQFSSDGSLDATNSRKNGSVKERKLSDRLDNERHNKLSLEGDVQCGGEGNLGYQKEKKYIVLNTETKSVTEDDDKLQRESGMKRGFLSDSRDQMAVRTEVKSVSKVQQPRKNRKNVTSYQAFDCFDPLSKDLGSGQLSLAATSSSSKVSGSHKARTYLEDVRSSPVESVTSSPLRTSNLDKRILAIGDTSEKVDARKGGLSSMSSKKSLGNKEGKLSVKVKEERTSYDLHLAQHGHCGNGSHHEEKMNKSNQESALSWQKSGKVTSLRVKEKDRSSGAEVSRDQMKVSASDSGFSKNGMSYESAVNPSHHDSENKTKLVLTGSRNGKAKVLSSSEGEVKRETLYVDSSTAPGLRKGDMSNGHPVHASGNDDVTKLERNSVDISSKVGVNCSSGSFPHHGQLCESSPVTTISSQTALNILEEASKLKDSADHYKNSGFEFESNETYFKAALKFLLGASLLDNCHSESSKHGEMNQMQIYATTAKLFESCAHKYERHQEMAAATLAYKCMEVVYMRLVYCRHYSINKDRHELQSTLQMVSQGESPSSSVSDIDNLNNLAVVDKANLTRGTNTTHFANNQVIFARNHPNIVRLLDFTQDINFAMGASRKCQSTFMAANLIMEEAQNRDFISPIRKVVDFSFQDVDEFVHLVLLATKAITRAGLVAKGYLPMLVPENLQRGHVTHSDILFITWELLKRILEGTLSGRYGVPIETWFGFDWHVFYNLAAHT